MDIKTIIIHFNKIIENLLEQTQEMMGDSYLFYFKKIVKINCLKPLETFYKYGYPHKEYIIKKNPKYFLNDDNIKKNLDSNYDEYLHEAHRTLKLDGQLHIWEATSRFKSINDFRNSLEKLGFTQIEIQEKYRFTYIIARKDRTNINYNDVDFKGL